MHFLKEGQKIRAWVEPPPHHSGNARKKTFFSIDAFPYNDNTAYIVSSAHTANLLLILLKQLLSKKFIMQKRDKMCTTGVVLFSVREYTF